MVGGVALSPTPAQAGARAMTWQPSVIRAVVGARPSAATAAAQSAPSVDPRIFLPPGAEAQVGLGAWRSAGLPRAGGTATLGAPSSASPAMQPPSAAPGFGAGHAFRHRPLPSGGITQGRAGPGAATFRPIPAAPAVPFRAVPGTVPPMVRAARAQKPPEPGVFVPFR